jgi:type IV secretion system protein VirB10
MATAKTAAIGDVRPLVGRAVNNRSLWIFGGVLAIAALGLFLALESRRTAITSPATAAAGGTDAGVISAPPSLAMPTAYSDELWALQNQNQAPTIPARAFVPETLPGVPRGPNLGQSARIPQAPIVRPAYTYDQSSPDAPYRPVPPQPLATSGDGDGAAASPSLAGAKAGISRLANPAYTLPQGALIQAVLETALDSNRPGFVRAIVQRDVRSFDGSRILIPRGSRLFGEYKADLVDGQNRAFILWQKLTRPDGVLVAIESPAADPLGRAGVKGSVDTHFFQRFAGSILQSSLDIGVGIATRSATDGTIIYGLPGGGQTAVNPGQSSVRPTLKVRHGASVSVFVARDLDFSSVD